MKKPKIEDQERERERDNDNGLPSLLMP